MRPVLFLFCCVILVMGVPLCYAVDTMDPGDGGGSTQPSSGGMIGPLPQQPAPGEPVFIGPLTEEQAAKSNEKPGQNFKSTAGKSGIGSKINDFMRNEYGSLGSLGGDVLGLIGGDAYKEWKASVDKAFCDTVILGGKSCWIAKICGSSPENAGGDGVLVSQKFTNTSLTMKFIAHVEGDRMEPTYNETGNSTASYLYRVTYAIRNPERREPNAFQLRFFYDGGSYDWYPDWQPFNKGSYIKAIGTNAIVAYSTNRYTRVCLVFQKTVEVNGQPTRQVCNVIVQYNGGPTTPYGEPAPATTSATGAAAPVRTAGDGF